MSVNPIAEIRKQLQSMSRKELALKMGVTESHLSLLLSNKRGAGVKVLDYLGLKIVYARKRG